MGNYRGKKSGTLSKGKSVKERGKTNHAFLGKEIKQWRCLFMLNHSYAALLFSYLIC